MLVSRFLLDLQVAHRYSTGARYLSEDATAASLGTGSGSLVFDRVMGSIGSVILEDLPEFLEYGKKDQE